MQEDIFPAAEKILSDIDNILRKDTNLQSFEIIPVTDNENKSPVYHTENSLGLASWCIQPLYIYTYNRLLDLREKKPRREDPANVSRWLIGALLLNPDVSTFWNMRRDLVRSGRLDHLQELRFTKIILYHKAKCFEAFSYRRWLMQLILIETKKSQEPQLDPEALLRTELSIAGMSADRYANNYHAWNYREYIVATYETLSPESFGLLLISEWEKSGLWCNKHVSDHSGFSYRQYLLKKILLLEREPAETRLSVTTEEFAKRRELIFDYVKAGARECNDVFILYDGTSSEVLDLLHHTDYNKNKSIKSQIDCDRLLMSLSYWIEDCKFNEDLINTFNGHETLWYHRRFLAYALRSLGNSYRKFYCYNEKEFRAKIFDDECERENEDQDDDDDDDDKYFNKSLLEMAFASRNRDIVESARKIGGHHACVGEKFVKYLVGLGFKL